MNIKVRNGVDAMHYAGPTDTTGRLVHYVSNGGVDRPYPVVTLCGSTRFHDEYMEACKELSKSGYITLFCNVFSHSVDADWWNAMDPAERESLTEQLREMHRTRIRMSDAIYVVNPGGYIGPSTSEEIEYARSIGLPVNYLEEPKC